MARQNSLPIAEWRRNPVKFITEVLRNPETGKPFELYDAQVQFLQRAFQLDSNGRLKYPELIFSCPKKSGKTCFASMVAIYMAVVLGGPYAEIWCLANDFEQAQGRVFAQAVKIVRASPLLAQGASITADRITWPATGSFIAAAASDEKGFAGCNPSLTIVDELWGYVSERSRRLWDESTPSPTRRISGRLIVSYAGFLNESDLLEGIYRRGIAGAEVAPDLYESPGTLCFWAHRGVAPWQDQRWYDELKRNERPIAFLRFAENRWVSSESRFIEDTAWDQIVDANLRPIISDRQLAIYVGLDASIRHDTTAIVACAYDKLRKRVQVVAHRCFRPNGQDVDFAAVEAAVLDLRSRFNLVSVSFDPFQTIAVAQRLRAQGVRTIEFQQTPANLTQAASNLYALITDRNITCYPSAELREAVLNASIVETPRGQRLAKERPSAKIDLCAALSFAALEAVQQGSVGTSPAEFAEIVKMWVDGSAAHNAKNPATMRPARPDVCHTCGEPIHEKTKVGIGAGVYVHAGRCPRDVAAAEAERVEREAGAAAAEIPPTAPEPPAPAPEPEPQVLGVNVDSLGNPIAKPAEGQTVSQRLDAEIRAEAQRRFGPLLAKR